MAFRFITMRFLYIKNQANLNLRLCRERRKTIRRIQTRTTILMAHGVLKAMLGMLSIDLILSTILFLRQGKVIKPCPNGWRWSKGDCSGENSFWRDYIFRR